MIKGNQEPLPNNIAEELRQLERMGDDSIDTTEMPEVLDWSTAVRGLFYRPRKKE